MQKEFFKWIDEALKTNDSTLITAICFNIYETEENLFYIEIIGADDYIENSNDWACREVTNFDTRKNPFQVNNTNFKGVLDTIRVYVSDYLKNGAYAKFLKSRLAVAIGFTDGDLYIVHQKPKRKLSFYQSLLFSINPSFKAECDYFEKAYAEELKASFKRDLCAKVTVLSALKDFNNNKYPRCLKKLSKVFDQPLTSKERCVIYLFSALCCEEIESFDQAITFYCYLLRDDPENSTALSNLSIIHKKLGNMNIAVGFAEKAVEADPTNCTAIHNAASAYFDKFNFEKAKFYAQKALQIKADFRVSLSLLAMIYALENDNKNYEYYKTAAIHSGQDQEALESAIENIRGNYEEHLKICAKVEQWKKLTKIPAIHFTLDGEEGKSIIGGQINEVPPVSDNGVQMKLLAAIFFSELPSNNIFPQKGVLRFYITPDEYYGADFDNFTLNVQKGFKVIFDEDEEKFDTYHCCSAEVPFPVNGSYTPKFYIQDDFLLFCDYRFEKTFDKIVSEKENTILSIEDKFNEEFIEKIYDEHHKLSGCSCFAQEDIRDYGNEYAKYDFLLLQLVSDYDNKQEKTMFGDAGVCNFFIPSQNLKNKDFSDILYTWDCG